MESQAKADVNEIKKEGGGNERSSIEFPYSDIDSSVELVKGVHDVGGTACDYDQLAAHMGMEAKGGGFRIRVASAKIYGLLLNERGRITLTELGRQIIDPQSERTAKAEAFQKVQLYSKVFDTFKGSPLPPPAALERAMISMGVGNKVAKNARQVFMRSAQQSGYFEISNDRLTAPPIRTTSTKDPTRQQSDAQTGGSGNGGGGELTLHPLIQGLLMTLPKETGPWPIKDRANWLEMANSIFKMIYPSQDGEVTVEVKKDEDV